ncbi:hypothetical protein [Faecalibacterium sp. 9]|uniref:hypothetical protein n=1 Tax=unclassified Faecalibacterium TaxID=2646395 RepID=UPI0020686738|nr:MAG TPA: Protein of unknown function (DUF1492) [Caudoviricetes sp.]
MEIRAWRAQDPAREAAFMEVKDWFRKLRDLAEGMNIQHEMMAKQRDAATRVTQSFSGMPMSAGNGDKILDAVCKMDSENRELSRMESELVKRRIEAISRVFCIVSAEDDSTLRMADAVRAYYIECETTDKDGYFKLKTYDDVAAELGISRSTVSDAIREGLQALAEIWPYINKDCA